MSGSDDPVRRENAYLPVDLEATELLAPEAPRVTRWRWVAAPIAAVGVVLLVGLNYAGVFAAQPRSPLAHLNNMQDKLISAFTSRALRDTSDFNLAFDVMLNEEGASDPDAMGVKASMKIGDSKGKWPLMTIIFDAADGKQDRLQEKLEKVFADVVKMEKDQSGPKGAEKLKELVSFEKCDGGVAMKMKLPKTPQESEDDKAMMADFKKHQPTFTGELSFGRTIKQMYDNADSNMVTLPHGVHAKIGAGIASTVFDMLGDVVPSDDRPVMEMMKGFTRFSASEKLIYKKNADKQFAQVPSLHNELNELKRQVQGCPLGKHLKGLNKLMTGISRVSITGMPMGWELDAKMHHFHPAPMLAAMTEEE